MKPLRTLSKAEFEGLTHPEKLEYLGFLLDAVNPDHPGNRRQGFVDDDAPSTGGIVAGRPET